jgi:hypothetical protein
MDFSIPLLETEIPPHFSENLYLLKTNLSLSHLFALLFIFLQLHNEISIGPSSFGNSHATHLVNIQWYP